MKKKKTTTNGEFTIDESQFEIDQSKYKDSEDKPQKTEELESLDDVAIDEKNETIHFPWFIGIVIGVLMVIIIALIIVIKVLEG